MPHVLGRVNVVNMPLLSKVSHRFNANPSKTAVFGAFFFFLFLDLSNSPVVTEQLGRKSLCLTHNEAKQYQNFRAWSRGKFIAGPCKEMGTSQLEKPKILKGF